MVSVHKAESVVLLEHIEFARMVGSVCFSGSHNFVCIYIIFVSEQCNLLKLLCTRLTGVTNNGKVPLLEWSTRITYKAQQSFLIFVMVILKQFQFIMKSFTDKTAMANN